MPLTAELLLDRLATHFAHRRDALDVIGRFGNRFEDWIKWEAAVGLHVSSFVDAGDDIGSVAVERDDCDLFVGRLAWPGGSGYPPAHKDDVWIEFKARCTRDKGPAELACDVAKAINTQRARKGSNGLGVFLTIAVIVAHPARPDVGPWLIKLSADPSLPAKPIIRRIYTDSRTPGAADDSVMFALIGWET